MVLFEERTLAFSCKPRNDDPLESVQMIARYFILWADASDTHGIWLLVNQPLKCTPEVKSQILEELIHELQLLYCETVSQQKHNLSFCTLFDEYI